MNKMQELYDEAARNIAEQIDFEIIEGILVDECGWTKIESPSPAEKVIVEWLHLHCKNRWKRRGDVILFESVKDANWFTLRWSA